jgi:integration host factor subunit beta
VSCQDIQRKSAGFRLPCQSVAVLQILAVELSRSAQGRTGESSGPVEASDERAYNAFMDLPAGIPRAPKAPKSFTRSELIRRVYERFQRNRGEEDGPRLRRRAEAESLIIAVLDEIAGALERGMRVELRGVGVLTVKGKRARQGRNPRTGEALIIDPHRVVRFRVSELLLARLNQPSRRPERQKSDPRQVDFPD